MYCSHLGCDSSTGQIWQTVTEQTGHSSPHVAASAVVNKNSTNNLTDFASWGEPPAEVRLDPISPGRVRDSRRDAQLLTERGFRALRLSRVLSDGGGPVTNPLPVRACCSLSEKCRKRFRWGERSAAQTRRQSYTTQSLRPTWELLIEATGSRRLEEPGPICRATWIYLIHFESLRKIPRTWPLYEGGALDFRIHTSTPSIR